ncbi:MAG: hypothetical protein ACRDRD_21055 [Pseudonocardiaceae bacterium]
MTDHDDQRPAATTTGKGAPTLTRRQHHTPPDTPDVSATAQHTPVTKTQPLATYIRHVVDTAPRPTPDQLTRLAGLLRNTDDNPDMPS